MDIERNNGICPNCRGKLEIDNIKGCYRCLHCGTEFRFKESDRVTAERIRSDANVRAEHDRNETYKTIQSMKGKVEIEKSKHKITRLFLWAIIIVILIGSYAGWRLVHRIDNYQVEQSHKGKIEITSTITDYSGTRFNDMEMYLRDAGFTDVEGVPLNDLTQKLVNKEGLIAFVPIRKNEVADDATTGQRVLQFIVSLSRFSRLGFGRFE